MGYAAPCGALDIYYSLFLCKELRSIYHDLVDIAGQLYDVAWGQKLLKMCHGKGPPTGKHVLKILPAKLLYRFELIVTSEFV